MIKYVFFMTELIYFLTYQLYLIHNPNIKINGGYIIWIVLIGGKYFTKVVFYNNILVTKKHNTELNKNTVLCFFISSSTFV